MTTFRDPAAVAANEVDPYDTARGNFPRMPTVGRLVAVLRPSRIDRGLQLMKERSRCIRAGDIHELILTDESQAAPGMRVDRVAYLGFAEFSEGGVIVAGDVLTIDDDVVGSVAGYDETHMPNHLNIIFFGNSFVSGFDRGFALNSAVRIESRFKDHRIASGNKAT